VSRIAFIGFGALAVALADAFRRDGTTEVRVFSRPRSDPESAAALQRQVAAAGARMCDSIQAAVVDAHVVIAAVPAGAADEIGARCAESIPSGALYVDPSPLPPQDKERLAAVLEARGGRYADVAVLGTVATDGSRVPMLAAGLGARSWADLGGALGLNVSVVAGPPGRASLVKLLRSVFMKGRDALILEMLLAARRYGVEQEIIDSMPPGEPFDRQAERVICSLAVYAGRRAEELAASMRLLDEAGVTPLASRGGYERLHALADMGLREQLHGQPPEDMDAVLALVERLAGDAGATRANPT
jgi:3-hydroxyisobutyrate dehydrogenase